MRCGTSFYNGTLGRQLTLRFWPLIALYTVIWAMFLPFVAITTPYPSPYGFTSLDVLYNAKHVFQWVPLFLAVGFGVLVAMAVCSHLYSTRSANFTAALPPKRTALFATHYLTGLLWLVVPFLVMAAIAMAIYQVKLQDFTTVFQVFGPGMSMGVGLLLFFYSFAVLCGMLTGHLLALPAFYAIFNGLVGGVWLLLTAIFQEFYYGYPGSVSVVPAWVEWLTPAWNLLRQYASNGTGISPATVAVYTVVGVLMALVAGLLYLKRPMERAGDVVIWAGLRPVFRYGVALCSGLALGSFTRIVLNLGPLGLAVSAILWGVAGCFVAQMFLTKSVRVLRYWKGAGAVALSFAALFGVIQLDLTGYETRVPDADDVVSVSISGLDSRPRDTASDFRNISTSDPEAISLLTQLHQQLVDQFDTDDFDWSNDDVTSLDLTYTLINGTRISRSYMVPLHETDETRPGTITYLAHQIVNNPDLMLSSYLFPHLEEKGYELLGADLYANYDVDPSNLSVSEARKVYEAVLQDIQEGNLSHGMFEYDEIITNLEFRWASPDKNSTSYYDPASSDIYYISVCVTQQAEHTLKVLEELGY